MNSHLGVPNLPIASLPTGLPALSTAVLTSTLTPSFSLPPMSIDGQCAIASRPSESRMSAT